MAKQYVITGTVTFSSQANRDAALTRVNNAVSGFTYTNVATVFTGGINTPNTTTITFSIVAGENQTDAATLTKTIYDALTSANRQTSGYLSVNLI